MSPSFNLSPLGSFTRDFLKKNNIFSVGQSDKTQSAIQYTDSIAAHTLTHTHTLSYVCFFIHSHTEPHLHTRTYTATSAMYLVLFQKDVGESIPTEEFLFVVGVWGVCLTPVALVFEPVVLPTARQAIALTLNAVVGTAVSERAWLYGATRCGPTTATMALALTIPCTAAIDVARGRLSGLHGASGLSWGAGLALICAGFVLASTSEEDVDDDGVLVTDAKPFDYEENSGGEDGALLNGRSPTMQSPAAMRDALRVEYEARVRGRLP